MSAQKEQSSSNSTSARLREQKQEILARWAEGVRQVIPDSRRLDRPALVDHLPVFLDRLADALDARVKTADATAAGASGRAHGEQRAVRTDYVLDGVIREYGVLRRTLFQVLETEGTIPPQDRDVILDAFDLAIEEATLEFVRIHNEALEQSEEQYRLLVESAQDYAIFTLDPRGCVVTWNSGGERITGYSPEEIIGREGAILFTPEDRARGVPEQEIRTAAAHGRAEDERWHIRKDGTRFFASGVVMALADGEMRGFAKVMRDITERKRMEEELRERADALAEADRRKDQFLAMLAHELRNPLAPILSAVALMRSLGPQDETLHRARDAVDRQVHHLARLVDDLLDVSRITQGKITLQKQIVDLRTVVACAVQTSRPFIEARQHQFTVSMPQEPVELEADPTRLEQVLSNLLSNAAKYTDPGGHIWLTVEVEGSWLRVEGPEGSEPSTLNPQPSTAVVRVRDTGIGIPAEMLPSIFDIFMQIDPSLDRSQGGLGLGLTLVRDLVEMHGGAVQAFSEGPGKGAEFTVRLPIADCGLRIADWNASPSSPKRVPAAPPDLSEPASGSTAATEPRSPAVEEGFPNPPLAKQSSAFRIPQLQDPHSAFRIPQSRRVLVVDDNRDAAETMADLLRLWGYEVRLAHHGQAALRTAKEYCPEIVLLDIGLPGMDGFGVATALRQDPATASARIIAITGYGQEEHHRSSREAGFDFHLTKPVDPEALQALLVEQ
jgi:PAS domain S-box-containing protein